MSVVRVNGSTCEFTGTLHQVWVNGECMSMLGEGLLQNRTSGGVGVVIAEEESEGGFW